MSQIFKVLFQTGNINILVPCGIVFGRYVQIKSWFRPTLVENCGKVLKEHFVTGISWSSAKLFMIQNCIDNANGDLSLTVEIT